jgi:hypothetical protein
MLFLIVFFAVGIGLGLSIRKIAGLAKTSERVLTFWYYPCLFFIGAFLRLDEKIVSNIDKIGWRSFFNIFIGFGILIIVAWSAFQLSKIIIAVKKA